MQTLIDNAGYIGNPAAGGTIGPTINGTTLPMSPGKAFANGQINKVGLMIGVDRDEFNGGPIDPPFIAANPAQYEALVQQQFGPLASKVMSLYPVSRFPKPSAFIAYRTVMADSASFAFLFTRVGLSGADMGAAYLLPRMVGLGRATELLMLGEQVTAERAVAIGLAGASNSG